MSRTLFNKSLLVFFLLLLIPLALAATTVQTDASSYNSGETVTISGTCSSASLPVGVRALLDGETVWFDQVTSDASKSYVSKFVPPQKGTYTITAACQGDTAVTTQITVADATTTPTGTDTGTPSNEGPSSGSSSSSSSGSFCTPDWVYSEWSKCGADFQQTRTAVQGKTKCANAKPKAENVVRSCEVCEESWSCGEWLECDGGLETRDCYDDTQCGTFALQPEVSRACEAVPSSQEQSQPSKPFFPQVTEVISSFWDDYQMWIIGVPISILLVILLVILLWLLFKKKLVYDEDEVRAWAKKERIAGTSLEDIKTIVHQYTRWNRAKIDLLLTNIK